MLINCGVNAAQFLAGVMQRLAFHVGNFRVRIARASASTAPCHHRRLLGEEQHAATARPLGDLAQFHQLLHLVFVRRRPLSRGRPLAALDEQY